MPKPRLRMLPTLSQALVMPLVEVIGRLTRVPAVIAHEHMWADSGGGMRPVLDREDAAAIKSIPEIRYAGLWIQLFGALEHQGVRTQLMTVFAADDDYMEIQGGTLLRGRFFTRSELSGANVIVLEEAVADRLFGRLDPIGRNVRMSSRSLRVIGIYRKPSNIFEPPSQEIAGIMPFETARTGFFYDDTNALFICVKPDPGVSVDRAQDLVTVALRRSRQLRPGVPNTFDLISQDQILETVNGLTSIFFLVSGADKGGALAAFRRGELVPDRPELVAEQVSRARLRVVNAVRDERRDVAHPHGRHGGPGG